MSAERMGLLPYGGREIADLRGQGKCPADMVILSLIGPLREKNPVLVAKPERAYDWRFLVGLEVMVVANSTVQRGALRSLLAALQALPTAYLGLWLADRQDGVNLAWMRFDTSGLQSVRRMDFFDRKRLSGLGRNDEVIHAGS